MNRRRRAGARGSRTSPKSVSPGTAARTAAAPRFDGGAARGACRATAGLSVARPSILSRRPRSPACTNKERWLDHGRALVEGESLAKAAERCRIHPSTAFRWRHRFLATLNHDKPKRLSGVVEADETFILESFKGRRGGLARPARRRGGKAAKRGLSDEHIPVVVARDRRGGALDAVLPRLDAASLKEAFAERIAPSTDFCCDGGAAITAFARRAKLKIHVLPAPGAPKPEHPEFHINNVNAHHGRLKAWMRRFHGVATENLQTYLSWRRTLEAIPANGDPELWIAAAAGCGPYQHELQ
jgi:ISXO2-like transposase domain